MGEMGDEVAHGGDIWINEAEIIMIAKLDQSLCLSGVVPGCAWVEGLGTQVLSHLLELM